MANYRERGLIRDKYMRFLVIAAKSKYLNTVDIHIATGGDAMLGYYPIRRASHLAQRLQEFPYGELVVLFGNGHDFWAFCVNCISHALYLEESGDSTQAYYYLCLAGTFHGLLIGIDKLIPIMPVLCDHACKVCKAMLEREHPLPVDAQEYLHLTMDFVMNSSGNPSFHH